MAAAAYKPLSAAEVERLHELRAALYKADVACEIVKRKSKSLAAHLADEEWLAAKDLYNRIESELTSLVMQGCRSPRSK